jgi:hypothetical protein
VDEMKYPERRVLQLELADIDVDHLGWTEGPYFLHVKLLHPRVGIDEESRVVPIRRGRQALENGADFTNAPLHRRMVLKEDVEGPFSIMVMLAEQKDGEISNDLIDVIQETSTELGKRIIGEVTVATIRAYIDFFTEKLEPKFAGLTGLAFGYVELNSRTQRRNIITFETKSASWIADREVSDRDIQRWERRYGPDGETTVFSDTGSWTKSKDKPEQWAKKPGDPNGTIQLNTWLVEG